MHLTSIKSVDAVGDLQHNYIDVLTEKVVASVCTVIITLLRSGVFCLGPHNYATKILWLLPKPLQLPYQDSVKNI